MRMSLKRTTEALQIISIFYLLEVFRVILLFCSFMYLLGSEVLQTSSDSCSGIFRASIFLSPIFGSVAVQNIGSGGNCGLPEFVLVGWEAAGIGGSLSHRGTFGFSPLWRPGCCCCAG
jgi:hypothetical protein